MAKKKKEVKLKKVINTCKVADYVSLYDLEHHPKNEELRSISESRMNDLKDSLKNKGLYEPILIQKDSNYVLAGNQRLKAMKELVEEGYTFENPDGDENYIPVVIEDVDDARALEILHQANNHHGSWIEEKLAEAIKEAEELGIEASALGYSEDYLKRIMKESEELLDKMADEDEEESKSLPTDVQKFILVIECKNEDEHQELFSELIERDINVKMMS